MPWHCDEQLEDKRNAIEIAIETFVVQYMEGFFEDNNELMYHQIENINSLIIELKRG